MAKTDAEPDGVMLSAEEALVAFAALDKAGDEGLLIPKAGKLLDRLGALVGCSQPRLYAEGAHARGTNRAVAEMDAGDDEPVEDDALKRATEWEWGMRMARSQWMEEGAATAGPQPPRASFEGLATLAVAQQLAQLVEWLEKGAVEVVYGGSTAP